MKKLLFLIIVLIGQNAMAQYSLQWYATYDNPHPSYIDYAVDLVEDDSGNIYVTGTSFQINLTDDWRYDFATIKYNSAGDSLWTRRYDSKSEDRAISVGIDGKNFIYVGGNSFNGHTNGTVIKYDADGNVIWLRSYEDTTLTVQIILHDMIVDLYGNVYLAFSYHGISYISEIVKYNANGELLWVAKYFKQNYDINNILTMALDKEGSIVATGCSRLSGTMDRDYLTLKYDQQGNLVWEARTNQSNDDIGYTVKTDNFGNVYVAGYSKTSEVYYDMKLIKYNTSGEEQWIRSYTGRREADGFGQYIKKKMIALDGNRNVYLNFTSYRIGSGNDIATSKYSPNGDLEWINIYSLDPLESYEESVDIKLDKSNCVYATGLRRYPESSNSFVILKYDKTGALQKVINNENQFPNIFHPASVVVNDHGDVTATGSSLDLLNPNVTDYFTVKYSNSTGIQNISNSTPSLFKLYQNYPNPFNPNTKIKYEISKSGNVNLKVFNVLGKEIVTLVNQNQISGVYEVDFDGNNLAGGIYFYVLESEDFKENKKMIILK